MNGAQALARQLEREGVRDIFAIPGVQMDLATDALLDVALRYRLPRHEQAASYMADGYARAGGRPGVCMVVPGPGLLNAMSGLATAFACNSRVLCIAGQIASPLIGQGRGVLHELRGQSALLGSVTKWHALARSAAEIAPLVHQTFRQLASGRPQPVGLEIPPDVLAQTIEAPADGPESTLPTPHQAVAPLLTAPDQAVAPVLPAPSLIEQAAALLRAARLPLIWAGGGSLAARAGPALLRLATALQAPVVVGDNGRGVIPDEHALALTSLGSRALLPHADVVLVVGSRFLDGRGDAVATGPAQRFIYVNTDAADMGAPRAQGLALQGDAAAVGAALADAVGSPPGVAPAHADERAALLHRVRAWCELQLDHLQPQMGYVRALRAALPDDAVLVSEMTQVGYVANLAFPVRAGGCFIGAGYQGTLGFGFPTAIGAALASPGRFVVSINGDGGFGFGLQELATAAHTGVHLAIVVFNDGAFGNVRRIQRAAFGREHAVELHNPQFVDLARAFGVYGERIDTAPAALQAALGRARARGGPSLIEVPVGEMPGPWHLIHRFSKAPREAPPDPLG